MSLTVKAARAQSRAVGPGVGDPGLFGSIGRLIGKVASVAKIVPGPIGWAGAAVSKVMPRSAPGWRERLQMGAFQDPSGIVGQVPQVPGPGIAAFAQRLVPGGETGMVDAPPIGAPAGYHVNKTEYWVKDKDGNWTFVPKESRWVKNRRRNPLNPRAASKAIGRIESLKRATSRYSRITIRPKCCHTHARKAKKK